MSEPKNDGRAARGWPHTPARDRNLVEPIRTYANSIIGFAEMLEDPDLLLSAATRREYVDIVRASGAALDQHIRAALPKDLDAA